MRQHSRLKSARVGRDDLDCAIIACDDRRLDCALKRTTVTRIGVLDLAQACLERMGGGDKTRREILYCLKRRPVRFVWRSLRADAARRRAMLAAIAARTQPVRIPASGRRSNACRR